MFHFACGLDFMYVQCGKFGMALVFQNS